MKTENMVIYVILFVLMIGDIVFRSVKNSYKKKDEQIHMDSLIRVLATTGLFVIGVFLLIISMSKFSAIYFFSGQALLLVAAISSMMYNWKFSKLFASLILIITMFAIMSLNIFTEIY
ncbi:heme/copper-type cytochrome/quinol oxidase subunit 2 [Sporosarcina luteola]|nr:heme/copper-type cytochrome/quinol oxidase subunit 2 [Sporosarcina luteola]